MPKVLVTVKKNRRIFRHTLFPSMAEGKAYYRVMLETKAMTSLTCAEFKILEPRWLTKCTCPTRLVGYVCKACKPYVKKDQK